MKKDEKRDSVDFDMFRTAANILDDKGKSEEDIRKFLEYHFPITSAIMEEIMKAVKKKHSKLK